MKSSQALREATGRDYADWFALLDEWGATTRPYPESSAWLREQGVSAWWAQKLIVEYEQLRGVREAGVRSNGTFTATATKTIAVSAEQAFAAVVDDATRRRWLSSPTLVERGATPPKSARFDGDDGTRLSFTVLSQSGDKCQVAVEQARLPSTAAAEAAKVQWREQLTGLKDLLEASSA